MRKIFNRATKCVLVGIMSLALFACNSEGQTVKINFNDDVYVEISEEENVNTSDIECSYTESISQINDELKEVYDALLANAKEAGQEIDIDYEYMSVDSVYIYKIQVKDNKEHTIMYHNNFYKEYRQEENCYTCIINVKNGEMPTYDMYDINENTYFKINGTAYIFYGRLDSE